MKKTLLLISLVFVSLFRAQEIPFDKLIGNSAPQFYSIGHYPVVGTDGLLIKWHGGVRIATSGLTALQVSQNNNIGIGTENPSEKFTVFGNHENSRILLSSEGNGMDQPANLVLWASEPSVSYTGVGIGNNITNYANASVFSRINNSRGGSYMRLLENEINFNIVSSSGIKLTPLTLHQNGNASLQGKFEAKEVKVTTTPTADFVFDPDYNLPALDEVEKYITEKRHLPEIASAEEMERDGVNMGEFQIKLLQKIEELTLYTIEQHKMLKVQEERIRIIEEQLNRKTQP